MSEHENLEPVGNDPEKTSNEVSLRAIGSISQIDKAEWSQLTGTSPRGDGAYNPFISYAFLSALEDSGCVGRKTGWLPQHLALEAPDGTLLGAVPCYVKSHSRGEYVFDHGWADAFERAGGNYYPKLQISVPFTPATGPRLLVLPGDDREVAPRRAALVGGIQALAKHIEASSAHVTFAEENDISVLCERGFLHRTDQQFHFINEGYSSYLDFLGQLASRKRKALRKEREAALSSDISIHWLTGSDLTEEIWDSFYEFYMDTGSRKWGQPYLNRTFFSLIGERMADDILLIMAKRNGRYIAGAINFIGSERLFGRNWGCIEDHPYLHFEVCYHQAIDFAIERGLKVVEAGAQGQHKLARGYVPVTTHSAHYIANPSLRRAIADYLTHERSEVAKIGEYLTNHVPFRNAT